MLHIVRGNVTESGIALCLEVMNHARCQVSRIDHLPQRLTGFSEYKTVAELIKTDDFRSTDAVLVTDKAPVEDIAKALEDVISPLLIMSGDPAGLKEKLRGLTAYIERVDVEILQWEDDS